MLIEKRVYTLRPGLIKAFMQAQADRGFEPVRPILEKLIGYFSTEGGPRDDIVHLYRFDSYDDWVRRLHGLYTVPELEPYFRTVRPLMLAQENEFLAPAPFAALTPLWGNGNDAELRGALGNAPSLDAPALIEQHVTQLLPGKIPAYWEAWKSHGARAGEAATRRLIGVFTTAVGQQHKVTWYRWHADRTGRDAHRDELAGNAHWQAFQAETRGLVASYETRLLTPAPFAEMSPMFPAGSRAPGG
jgi:hypothetical protein